MPEKTKLYLAAVIIAIIIIGAGYWAYVSYFAPKPQAKYKFAIFISTLGNPYFVTLKDGAQTAADELNVKLLVYDAQNDPQLQLTQVEEAIGLQVDALLINPCDKDAIVPAIEEANDAGIPVITTDRDAAGGERLCFIGSDNVHGGELAAKALIEGLRAAGKPQPWKIVILNGIPGTTAAIDRKTGFHNILDAFKENGTIEEIIEEVANFDRNQGYEKMATILADNPDVVGVVAANDEMALGAIEAIEDAGKTPGTDIIVVGYDAIDDAVAAIKEGKMYATIAQSPFLQGYWAVYAAYKYLEGEWTPPQFFIPTPLLVVTSENADTFASEVKTPQPLPGDPPMNLAGFEEILTYVGDFIKKIFAE